MSGNSESETTVGETGQWIIGKRPGELSSFNEPVHTNLRFLFLANRSKTQCGLLVLSHVLLKVLRLFSTQHGCKEWLFGLLKPV